MFLKCINNLIPETCLMFGINTVAFSALCFFVLAVANNVIPVNVKTGTTILF